MCVGEITGEWTRWLAIQIMALKVWIFEFGKRIFIGPLIGCFPLHKKYRLYELPQRVSASMCSQPKKKNIYIYNEINLFNPHYIPLYPHAIRIIPCSMPCSAHVCRADARPQRAWRTNKNWGVENDIDQLWSKWGKPHVWRFNCVFMRIFWALTKK